MNNVPQCEIAKYLGISYSMVHNVIKRFRESIEISVYKDKSKNQYWMDNGFAIIAE